MPRKPSLSSSRRPRRPGRLLLPLLSLPLLLAVIALAVGLRGQQQTPHPTSAVATPSAAGEATSVTWSFFSSELQREMPVTAFLPPGYDGSDQRYPVVYMLHGLSGTNEEWLWYGLPQTAAAMMQAGELAPFIIVLPQGDDSYWVDHDDGARWSEYLSHEVVAQVDARFRTLTGPGDRGIGGLSMGADGALQNALTHPDVFQVVVASSPVLRSYDSAPGFYGDVAFFQAHSPPSLIESNPDVARGLTLSIDVGDNDQWLPNAEALADLMASLQVPADWHIWPGAHDGVYWSTHVPDYLRFFADAFSRAAIASPGQ
jgi:S-formylglutathione hydrolase FrmB